MKRKVFAMMMSLTLAMAVTACGGSDTETDAADTAVEETVDDTAEADEAEAEDVAAEDATEETEEDLGPGCTLSKQQWHRMLQELPGIS